MWLINSIVDVWNLNLQSHASVLPVIKGLSLIELIKICHKKWYNIFIYYSDIDMFVIWYVNLWMVVKILI